MKYRLGDICTIIKGATGIMKAIPGPYTMIALGESDKTHIEYQFDIKAVIIPLVSSTGHGHASMKRVKYCEGKFALGNILCAVIPKNENFVLAKYLHIYLHWNREELLVTQMKGMANVSLPMNRIADVMVTVPSVKKQIEIIELEKQLVKRELEVDKLFANQLTQLENLNQAILQEAVQGKLVNQDKKDELASELLKRIKADKAKSGKKDKPLPPIKPEEIPFEIPKNWIWCRLGEIADRIHYGFNASAKPDKKEVKLLRITDIQDNKVNWATVPGCDYSKSDLENYLLNENDIVIARTGGTIGKTFLVKGLAGKSLFASYLIRVKTSGNTCPEFVKFYLESPLYWKQLYGAAWGAGQPNVNGTALSNLKVPLPSLSEQKRIVAEIEKQFTKTKQLKERIISNQQATEQLLKALLHQAFEVNEEKVKTVLKTKGKVVELASSTLDWDNLVAEPFEKYAAHPVNNIRDIDWEMAMMVACMKNKLGVTYGDVGLQKNVYNTNHLQPIFSKKYAFANSNFGTYCHELKEDLKRNPYLIAQKVANNKEVYTVNPKYNKQILDKLSEPENKEFVLAINIMLSIYEHPFINKETDKIELYNTVLKVALDKNTRNIDSIYQGMEDWKINQTKYKTKAEKFTKRDAERMLKLLMEKKIL